MKTIVILILAAFGMSVQAADKLFDDELAKNAVAVLRVHRVGDAWPVANYPFTYYVVNVSQVFKNDSNAKFNPSVTVSAFKGKDGVPAEECTIYLARYDVANKEFNSTNGALWMLVGGAAATGVSHIGVSAAPR